MRNDSPRLMVILLALLAVCAPLEAGKAGEKLPDLRLNFLGPDPDYANKPVLLEFWATWCPPCRESIPHLNELHAKYKDRGLVIIGVTDEASGVIRKFQKNTPMDYAVATDTGGKLNGKMGVNGIPHAFLADASGKIVWDGHPTNLREEQIEEVLGGKEEASAAPSASAPSGTESATAATFSPGASAETSASASAGSGGATVLQADDAAALESKLGSEVVVEGLVKEVGKTSGGGISFINFGDRKTGFTAVVFRSSLENFPEGLDKYSNQKVRVRGTMEKYQDRQLQIKVSTPDQLEIVSESTS